MYDKAVTYLRQKCTRTIDVDCPGVFFCTILEENEMNETNHRNPAEKANNPPAQKEWANPTPAGLVALAAACFVFFALLNGYVEKTAMPLIGCWLAGGFIVQFVVGILDLKGGNYTGGNTFLFFSAFFMLANCIEMFVKYSAFKAGTALDTRVDGYAWLCLATALIIWTPAFLKTFNLLSIIILLVDVALSFIALVDLRVIPASLAVIPAYALIVAAVFALYLSAALVVNSAYGKKVYPVFELKRK